MPPLLLPLAAAPLVRLQSRLEGVQRAGQVARAPPLLADGREVLQPQALRDARVRKKGALRFLEGLQASERTMYCLCELICLLDENTYGMKVYMQQEIL